MALPPRSRLGRGLSALLTQNQPDTAATSTDSAPPAAAPTPAVPSPKIAPPNVVPEDVAPGDVGPLRRLPLAGIDVNPHQPRRHFDEAELAALADSIRANGLIQPIVVRTAGDRFELIAGERRFRAAGLAGLSDVSAIVRDVDRFTQAQWALVENIHRADLNPMERAEAYAGLVDRLGLTQAELAGRLGEQRSSVANYLRLMELPPAVRDAVRSGDLTLGHAKVLAGLPAALAERLADQCRAGQWSVRKLEEAAAAPSTLSDAPAAAAPPPASLHYRELEQRLVQHLGVRVQVQKGKRSGSGKIVLHYASLDQFDELLQKWGIDPEDA